MNSYTDFQKFAYIKLALKLVITKLLLHFQLVFTPRAPHFWPEIRVPDPTRPENSGRVRQLTRPDPTWNFAKIAISANIAPIGMILLSLDSSWRDESNEL